MKVLFLIDANSLIYRCFHALPPFTAPGGQPTGALYGLTNILLKIFREEKPEYAVALFDRPEPTFREKIYPAYKAQRPKAPRELTSQIVEAHHLFQKFGIKTLEKVGAEADDLIASLVERFGFNKGIKIVILTSDLDTLQLVRDKNIVVRGFKKGISETALYDEKEVGERYGLKPGQLIDYKALVGDVSDNIKGISGIGPKTANKILQQFGSLEEIYRNLDKIPKLKEKLEMAKEQLKISKQLVYLDRNLEIDLGNLSSFRIAEDEPELKRYFEKMGFKTILKRLAEPKTNMRKKNNISSTQGRIF